MQQPPNDRADLVRLITENRDLFADAAHVQALYAVTTEDLIAGGVDQRRVLASMLRAWVVMVKAQIGAAGVVNVLRDTADMLEQPLLSKNPQPDGRLN